MEEKFTPAQVAVMCRDWAHIAFREAIELAGTVEGAQKMADHKRYLLAAKTIAELLQKR